MSQMDENSAVFFKLWLSRAPSTRHRCLRYVSTCLFNCEVTYRYDQAGECGGIFVVLAVLILAAAKVSKTVVLYGKTTAILPNNLLQSNLLE